MNFLPANRLRLYRNFKAIEANDFHGIVRYYEHFEDAIRGLDFEEYFDCTLAYTDALFETGNYGQHIVMCDHLLEIIIMQNIETWGGEDLYAQTLFRKSASLYQLHEYPKAEYVLRELVKIHPAVTLYRRFLEKSLLRQKPVWLMQTRAACVGLSLLAAAVIAVELFVVKPFFETWYQPAQMVHIILLAAGISVFIIGESLHGWRCRQAAVSFAEQMRRRKSV